MSDLNAAVGRLHALAQDVLRDEAQETKPPTGPPRGIVDQRVAELGLLHAIATLDRVWDGDLELADSDVQGLIAVLMAVLEGVRPLPYANEDGDPIGDDVRLVAETLTLSRLAMDDDQG